MGRLEDAVGNKSQRVPSTPEVAVFLLWVRHFLCIKSASHFGWQDSGMRADGFSFA